MGVEVSSDSASEAARNSIADMKLELAAPTISDVDGLVAWQAGQGRRS